MEIFVSAGDASSEMHGAQALRELQKKIPELKIFGLGGDEISKLGAELLIHSKEFSVGGGPLEVISRWPLRKKLERLLEDRLYQRRPQGALLVDNGEINLRLAGLLNYFKVPVIYYIPPKIWVWRSSRIEKIHYHVKKVLSILPFEKEIYDSWQIPNQFVGNPLLDELPLGLSPEDARKNLQLPEGQSYVSVLLGSRHSEVAFHSGIFAKSLFEFWELLQSKAPSDLKSPQFLFPVPSTLDFQVVKDGFQKHIAQAPFQVHFFQGRSHECLKASRAALIKSGTSTLEAGALQVPMVVAYQSGILAKFIFRNIVRYTWPVALVNLVENPEGEILAKEFILEECTPVNLAQGLAEVYLDGEWRRKQIKRLEKIPFLLKPPKNLGNSPSEAVAQEMLKAFQ